MPGCIQECLYVSKSGSSTVCYWSIIITGCILVTSVNTLDGGGMYLLKENSPSTACILEENSPTLGSLFVKFNTPLEPRTTKAWVSYPVSCPYQEHRALPLLDHCPKRPGSSPFENLNWEHP